MQFCVGNGPIVGRASTPGIGGGGTNPNIGGTTTMSVSGVGAAPSVGNLTMRVELISSLLRQGLEGHRCWRPVASGLRHYLFERRRPVSSGVVSGPSFGEVPTLRGGSMACFAAHLGHRPKISSSWATFRYFNCLAALSIHCSSPGISISMVRPHSRHTM